MVGRPGMLASAASMLKTSLGSAYTADVWRLLSLFIVFLFLLNGIWLRKSAFQRCSTWTNDNPAQPKRQHSVGLIFRLVNYGCVFVLVAAGKGSFRPYIKFSI